jgi:superfamily I DNA/RNA helicase
VVHEGGPLIVLAGPGTGKTRVIVSRIAHLIAERDADPGSILALTFTNKAAGEMRERLGQMLDPLTAERVHAHTFNGFGASLLRRFSDLAGLPREPSLIDSAQRLRMMRAIVRDRGLFRDAVASGIDEAIKSSRKRIGAMVAAGLTPASARERLRAHAAGLDGRGLDEIELVAERALTGDWARWWISGKCSTRSVCRGG